MFSKEKVRICNRKPQKESELQNHPTIPIKAKEKEIIIAVNEKKRTAKRIVC